MAKPTFGVFSCTKKAYILGFSELFYFLKIGIIPVALYIGLSFVILNMLALESMLVENILLGFASIPMFWFGFFALRLQWRGEYFGGLGDAEESWSAMTRTIFCFLFLSLGGTFLIEILLGLFESMEVEGDSNAGIGILVIALFLLWAVRLGMLPAAMAVGVPLKQFFATARGILLPFKLLFLGLFSGIPGGAFLFGASLLEGVELGAAETIVSLIVGGVHILLLQIFNTTAFGFALKQMIEEG